MDDLRAEIANMFIDEDEHFEKKLDKILVLVNREVEKKLLLVVPNVQVLTKEELDGKQEDMGINVTAYCKESWNNCVAKMLSNIAQLKSLEKEEL